MTTVTVDLLQPRSKLQDIKRRYSNFNTMQLNKKSQMLSDVLYLLEYVSHVEDTNGFTSRKLPGEGENSDGLLPKT